MYNFFWCSASLSWAHSSQKYTPDGQCKRAIVGNKALDDWFHAVQDYLKPPPYGAICGWTLVSVETDDAVKNSRLRLTLQKSAAWAEVTYLKIGRHRASQLKIALKIFEGSRKDYLLSSMTFINGSWETRQKLSNYARGRRFLLKVFNKGNKVPSVTMRRHVINRANYRLAP